MKKNFKYVLVKRMGKYFWYLNSSWCDKSDKKIVQNTIRYNGWYHSVFDSLFKNIKSENIANPQVILFDSYFQAFLVRLMAFPQNVFNCAVRSKFINYPILHKIQRLEIV